MGKYENINLEKGMYKIGGKSFSQVLEELDPSENYCDTPLEGMDAFQRQLKRFDIKVSGKGADKVEKFFQTTSSAALFPEYICRAVKTGMEFENVLPSICAGTTMIDSMDYRSIASTPTDDEKSLADVAEGAVIPETVIHTQENLIKPRKRGRMLVSSYEALKFQSLDLFTVTLKQIGSYIGKMLLNDAVNVLVNGDGNNNAADVVNGTSDLSYADLLDLWTSLAPYKLNTIIAPTGMVKSLLSLTEMKDANAGLNFHATGELITPLGAKLIHVPDMTADKIIGLDSNYALEMVQAGDIITEYDKLIDRQLERASISCIAGFAKVFKDASKILSY